MAYLHGEQLHEHFGLPGLASVVSRSFLTFSLPSAAPSPREARAEKGCGLPRSPITPSSRVMAYRAVGFRSLRRGTSTGHLVLERALDLAQGAHIRFLTPRLPHSWGLPYALAGRTAEALLLLEQAVEQAMVMRYMR